MPVANRTMGKNLMISSAIEEKIKQYSLLIIVPAFNEANNLAGTIADLNKYVPWADVLVVDDGSTDDTSQVAKSLGCRVLRMPFNIGIGGAVQAGYKFAQEEDYDLATQFDGDGQHAAKSLPMMLAASIEGQGDLIIGSRYLEANDYVTPLARRLGTAIFSKIVSYIIGQKITDSTSGFRVLNRQAIAFCAETYPSDYPEVEVLPLIHFAGLTIAEAPVQMNRRQSGTSSITWSRALYYMIKVILAISISLLREKPPRRKGAM